MPACWVAAHCKKADTTLPLHIPSVLPVHCWSKILPQCAVHQQTLGDTCRQVTAGMPSHALPQRSKCHPNNRRFPQACPKAATMRAQPAFSELTKSSMAAETSQLRLPPLTSDSLRATLTHNQPGPAVLCTVQQLQCHTPLKQVKTFKQTTCNNIMWVPHTNTHRVNGITNRPPDTTS